MDIWNSQHNNSIFNQSNYNFNSYSYQGSNTFGSINGSTNYLNDLGAITNAWGVAWGTGEIAAKYKGAALASQLGIEAKQIATQVPKFLNVASKVGKTIGTVGYVATVASIGTKYMNGETITTADKVNFGINTVIYGGTTLLAGTTAAPVIAVAAIVYGGTQVGFYIFTGGSIEDQVFKR